MNKQILEAKQSVVAEIVSKAKDSASVTIAHYRGLTVTQLEQLRRALRKEDAELCIYKNSLVERAVKELGIEGLDEYLTGPNAIIFSKDVSNGPKIASKFAKKFGDTLTIKGGVCEGKAYDKAGMIEIGKLPGRDGLISMFLSCLQAPVRSFACAVQAVADAK